MDYRDPKHLKPSEVITNQDINQLNTTLRDNSKDSIGKKISSLRSLLNKYHVQNTYHKRTMEDKEVGLSLDEKVSVNQIRLAVKQLQNQKADSQLVLDSDILFMLYSELGKLYEKVNDTDHATNAYLNALRYRDYSYSESYFLDTKNNRELENTNSKNYRMAHTNAKQDKELSEIELKKLETEYYFVQSETVREYTAGKITYTELQNKIDVSTKKFESERKTVEQRVQNADQSYTKSMTENLAQLQKTKNRELSSVLINLSKLVQVKEEQVEIKDREQRTNNTFQKDIFVHYDHTKKRDYPATIYLLEFAYKLDTDSMELRVRLADLYLQSQKYEYARDHYEEYIKSLNPSEPPTKQLSNVYKNLISTYIQLKQNVLAVEYLEKLMKILPNSEREQYYYFAGQFYYKYLGNVYKSANYYTLWLSSSNARATKNVSTRELSELKKMRFDAYYVLMQKDRLLSVSGETLLNQFNASPNILEINETALSPLENMYKLYKELFQLRDSEFIKLKNMEINFEKQRKILLASRNESYEEQIKAEKSKLDKQKEQAYSVQARYNSIRKIEVLNWMARLEEENRYYQKALDLYTEVLNIGDNAETENAIVNIKRVGKILEDGIKR